MQHREDLLDNLFAFLTGDIPEGSSFTAGERMHELAKVCAFLFYYFSDQSTHNSSVVWFIMGCVPLNVEDLFIVSSPTLGICTYAPTSNIHSW